ncbi:MAG: hypothetical protein ACYTEL_02150 [Planctomycetota bacterium]
MYRINVIVLSATVLLLVAELANSEIATVTYQVSAGLDDAYAWSATEQDVNSSYLVVGDDRSYTPPYCMSAMRFTSVMIPRGAAIISAYLKINSGAEGNRGQIYGVVQGESVDDPADFSSRYIGAAARTAAGVDWDHKLTWDSDTWQTSPDISTVIQEVVDRPGWNSGGSLVVFYSTRAESGKSRTFASFETAMNTGAILDVTCEVCVIAGHIRTSDGNGVEGVVVTAGSGVADAIADANGYYELAVASGWSGTVTPSKPGWGFDPPNRVYSNIIADEMDEDYTAWQPKISGRLTDMTGKEMVGVLVWADNGGGLYFTDPNGAYEATVPQDWSGTVMPAESGRIFDPAHRVYSNVVSDQNDQDYAASDLIHTTASLSVARGRFEATSVGGLAFFAGGTTTGTYNACQAVIDIYDGRTDQWSTASLSVARYGMDAVTVGNRALFVSGTDKTGNCTDVIDVYDANTGLWSTATFPVVGAHGKATVVGDKAIFTNGSTVCMYDADKGEPNDPNAWSQGSLRYPRWGLKAASAGNKALFAGGFWNNSNTAKVNIYDTSVGEPNNPSAWSMASLSQGRRHVSAASLGSKAIFAGGFNGDMTDRVDIYDAGTDRWTTAKLSLARTQMGTATVDTKAFFAGGFADGNISKRRVDIYDAALGEPNDPNAWYVELLAERTRAPAATALGNMVVVGGGFSHLLDPTADVDIFRLIPEGDFQPDGKVDLADYAIFAGAYNSTSADNNYNPACDISEPPDGIIDRRDFSVFVQHWLEGLSF